MDLYASYYEILNVFEDCSAEEIKSSFRKLALKYHPDKNNNSPESQTRFVLISNAYETLIDTVKKKEYDNYLRNSAVLNNWKNKGSNIRASLPGDIIDNNYQEALLNHFNFLLWEIEDFILKKYKSISRSKYDNKLLRSYILKILAFIDKWVLIPGGFPDYFMEARKKNGIDPIDLIKTIGDNQNKHTHQAYSSLNGYFYDIRKRADKFLEKITHRDLVENIEGCEIRLIDCVIEAQNYTIHYLSYLLNLSGNERVEIPHFTHSKSCFSE